MDWVERTFWLTDPRTGNAHQAVVVEEGIEEILNLEESGVGISPLSKVEPCATCPIVVACMGSRWADSKRAGGPSSTSVPVSIVHTCRTCGEVVLSVSDTGHMLAPKTCPRRASCLEGDLDCQHCQTKIQEECDDPDVLIRAQWVVGRLLLDAESRFPILTRSPRRRMLRQCLPGVLLVLKEDPENYAGAVQEFMLEISNAPPISLAWFAKSSAERRFIRRVWEGIARRTLVGLRDSVPGEAGWEEG